MNKVLVLVFSLLLSGAAFSAKVAKVDVQKVLLTVEDGQKVRSKLKKRFDEKQKIIKDEEDKIRKMQKDFQKQSLVMNDKAKAKKEREIQAKIVALQQKTMNFQKEIQAEENKLKKPILEKVRTTIEKISKDGKYEMVFEVSTAPIYVKNIDDITDEVVKAYNKAK